MSEEQLFPPDTTKSKSIKLILKQKKKKKTSPFGIFPKLQVFLCILYITNLGLSQQQVKDRPSPFQQFTYLPSLDSQMF